MRRAVLLMAVLLAAVLAVWALSRSGQQHTHAIDRPGSESSTGADTRAEAAPDAPRLEGRAADGPAAGAAETAVAGGVRIRLDGEVIDDDGEPLADVRVQLARVPPPVAGAAVAGAEPDWWLVSDPVTEHVAEGKTDEDGNFSFDLESRRGWAVVATKGGYGTTVVGDQDAVCEEGAAEASLVMTLLRASTLRLQVVSEGDVPIAGARIAQYTDWPRHPPVRVVITDDDGWFEVPATAGDALLVTAAGYARRMVDDLLERRGAPVVLGRPRVLAGVVVDEKDEPIEGAVVRADLEGLPLRVTDSEGRFSWNDVGTGPNTLSVQVSAWAAGRMRSSVGAVPGRPDLRVVLARPGALAGRVVLPQGIDIVLVDLQVHGGWYYSRHVAVEEGAFRVAEVPAGSLLLRAVVYRLARIRGADRRVLAGRGEVAVEMPPGGVVDDAVVRLEPIPISYVVSRIVDPDGRPLSDCEQHVNAPWGGESSYRTGADGVVCSVVAVFPGTPTIVTAVRTSGGEVRSGPVHVRTRADPSSEPVEIVMPRSPAEMPGNVRLVLVSEREDGAAIPPDAAANWYVTQGDGRAGGHNPFPRGPVAGGRWRGELILQAGVETRVDAWAKGCAIRRFVLPPLEHGEHELICRLKAASRVCGRLVTVRGRPARNGTVRVTVHPPGEPAVGGTRHASEIGPDGRFELDGLGAGPAHVAVSRPDGLPLAEREVTIPEGGTLDVGDIVVGTLPVLRGTVRDAEGHALGGVRMELFAPGGRDAFYRLSTRADGGFEVAVPQGTDTILRFSRNGCAPRNLRVEPSSVDRPRTVRLLRPGTLVVECDDPPGDLRTIHLRVREEPFGPPYDSWPRASQVGGTLRWTLSSLAIGPVRIEAVVGCIDGTVWTAKGRGEVVSGETTILRLEPVR